MPITGPSSYLTTVPLFINHWTDVNASIAPSAILLDGTSAGQPPGDVAISVLTGLFTQLEAARGSVEAALLDASLSLANGNTLKVWFNAAINAFNRSMRADHGTSAFATALASPPAIDMGRERFLAPVRLTEALWVKVNAWRALPAQGSKPPLELAGWLPGAGPVDVADFTAKLTELRAALNATEEREQQAGVERAVRDGLQAQIYPMLKVYRLKIGAAFPPGHSWVATLPALTEDSEATPEPGTLGGMWDPAANHAALEGTPSPSPSVVRHQIRASVGPEPEVEDEVMRQEYPLGEFIAHTSDYGLGAPGETVHFRLVAITADGHEKGTEWVSITRPE